MPIYAMWSLIVSLVLLALGLSLKIAHIKFFLKLTEKEIDSLVKQIALIKNRQEESVSGLTQFNNAEIEKILKEYRHQINILNEIILEMKTPTNYTAYLKEGVKPKMTLGLAKAIVNGDVVLK
jgi:hypothetical protein